MAVSDDQRVPEVPGYTIEKKLAQGGMGVVYVATDDALGRRVAIKMIRADVVGSTSDADDEKVAVTRFMNEARAAAQIKSSHVATVLTFGQTKVGDLYLVLEYLDGVTLTDVLKREKRLEVDRALRITQRVCRGLRAAHALGIVHRDLKPSNVMLVDHDGDPEFVKILDFGVAKKISDRESDVTRTGALIGTHTSMAPEQITGGAVDARTDIYAVGCLLFRLLTGKAPFTADDFVAVLHAHLHRAPPKPSSLRNDGSIPATLDALVVRCLAKDPKDRVPSMAELERLLGAIVERDPSLHISAAEASAPTEIHVDTDAPTQTPWATIDVDSAWSSSGVVSRPTTAAGASAPRDVVQDDHAPPIDPHTPLTGTRVAGEAVAMQVATPPMVDHAVSRMPWGRIAVGALLGSLIAFVGAAGVLFVVLDRVRAPTESPAAVERAHRPSEDAEPAASATGAEHSTTSPSEPAAPGTNDDIAPTKERAATEPPTGTPESGVVRARDDDDNGHPVDTPDEAPAEETGARAKKAAAKKTVEKTSTTRTPSAKTTKGAAAKPASAKTTGEVAAKEPTKPSKAEPVVEKKAPAEQSEPTPRAGFRRVRTAEDQ